MRGLHGTPILAVTAALLASSTVSAQPARAPEPGHGEVTFTKDVLPILQRSCQTCHRPGTAAPMSLLTYEQARPWARAIKDRVVSRQMPPWHVDRPQVAAQAIQSPAHQDIDLAACRVLHQGIEGRALFLCA